MPSDPSTGTTSKPAALKAMVSLPEPQPRSRTLAPCGRRAAKRALASDMSDPMVEPL